MVTATKNGEHVMKKTYTKPAVTKLGNVTLIKGNSTGPSSDGRQYYGYFK